MKALQQFTHTVKTDKVFLALICYALSNKQVNFVLFLDRWFRSQPNVDEANLVIVGHSLGGYHSLRLATGLSLPPVPS